MKTRFNTTTKSMKALSILALMFMMTFGFSSLQAQRFSAMLRVNPWSQSDANVDFDRSVNLGLDLRLYTNSKFAIRAGVGVENVKYTLSAEEGLTTDLTSKRNDLKGVFGLEWHPTLGKWLDFYPGLYIPVTVSGDDVINDNIANLTGGNFTAGLGGVLGANIRLLKVLRVGVEFDAKWESFSTATVQAIDEFSIKPLGRINYSTSIVLGIMI